MEIEIKIAFTRESHDAVNNKPPTLRNFSVPSTAPLPALSDLVSFGSSHDSNMFRVVNRWFAFESPEKMVLELLLDHEKPLDASEASQKGSPAQ